MPENRCFSWAVSSEGHKGLGCALTRRCCRQSRPDPASSDPKPPRSGVPAPKSPQGLRLTGRSPRFPPPPATRRPLSPCCRPSGGSVPCRGSVPPSPRPAGSPRGALSRVLGRRSAPRSGSRGGPCGRQPSCPAVRGRRSGGGGGETRPHRHRHRHSATAPPAARAALRRPRRRRAGDYESQRAPRPRRPAPARRAAARSSLGSVVRRQRRVPAGRRHFLGQRPGTGAGPGSRPRPPRPSACCCCRPAAGALPCPARRLYPGGG